MLASGQPPHCPPTARFSSRKNGLLKVVMSLAMALLPKATPSMYQVKPSAVSDRWPPVAYEARASGRDRKDVEERMRSTGKPRISQAQPGLRRLSYRMMLAAKLKGRHAHARFATGAPPDW